MKIHVLVWLLPLVGFWALIPGIPPPVLMVLIAITLFVAIKIHALLIYWEGRRQVDGVDLVTTSGLFGWFFVWWGLKPSEFFTKSERRWRPREAAMAIGKIGIGVWLLFFLAPTLLASRPIAAGWLGMVGIVFLMHFGYSHLTAVIYNALGRGVTPIMRAPVLASSVSEFWGRRWNLAFRDYAHVTVFRPVTRRFGAIAGSVAGFVFSGIIHEVAISVPAAAGYGWPLLYFLIQGAGVITERLGNKSGWLIAGSLRARLFAWLIAAAPIPMLFHQPFVLEVINPIVAFCGGLLSHG